MCVCVCVCLYICTGTGTGTCTGTRTGTSTGTRPGHVIYTKTYPLVKKTQTKTHTKHMCLVRVWSVFNNERI